MSTAPGPALGSFLPDLQTRLDRLSRDELIRLLVAHAERLPTAQRDAFLAIFPTSWSPDPDVPDATESVPGAAGDVLLQRIRDFATRVAAGDFGDPEGDWDDGWDGRYGWGDDQPVPAWVPDAEALFADACEVFLSGDPHRGVGVYDLLLDLFRPGAAGLSDIEPLDLWALNDTDVPEALARYLRCVYETTEGADPGDRAAAVATAWSRLPWGADALTLTDVRDARPAPLPGLTGFLPAWIDRLVDGPDWPAARDRVRLLAEAADLHHGLDTLADLAHRTGPHQGGIGEIRAEALATAGHLDEAVAAAQETLGLTGLDPGLHARLADRLAGLCLRMRDLTGAVHARQDAWQKQPTRNRLLAMIDDARHAGVLSDVLDAESARVLDDARRAGDEVGPRLDRLACALLLVAGHLDVAVEALTAWEPLGWSRPSHPGPLVLPVLWAGAIGAVPPDGALGLAFAAIDDLADTHERNRLLFEAPSERQRAGASVDGADRTTPAMTALLADTVARLGLPPARRAELLDVARAVTDTRIHAIVSGKHRSAYARAAALAYAHAEALASRSPYEATDYLAGVRARFPRHVAFRQELQRAATTSTLRPETLIP